MEIKINEILKALPHRYPFVLCDRILSVDYNKSVSGIKNVTFNEPYFQGHFPEEPIMPGVLLLETMAQIGGFIFYNPEKDTCLKAYVAKYDKARFTKPVIPGDTLKVDAVCKEIFGNYANIMATASVDNKKAASVEIMYCFQDRGGVNHG